MKIWRYNFNLEGVKQQSLDGSGKFSEKKFNELIERSYSDLPDKKKARLLKEVKGLK